MKYHNENFSGSLIYKSKAHYDGWQVELHLHEYSEILYCTEGEGEIIVNKRRVKLSRGEFVFIPSNYAHQLFFNNAKVICAVFTNDFIPLYYSATSGRRQIVSALSAEELTPVLEGLHLLKGESPLKICGVLNLIAEKAIAHSEFESGDFSDGVLYQKVVSYLSTHYSERLRLSDVAKHFGYNEKYLSHALHSLTGIHFSTLLAYYRVEHAKEMLRLGEGQSIATVAMESGFSAMNSFHRAFLKHTGKTPLEYRRSSQEKQAKRQID